MGSYPRMNESRTQAVSASAPRILPSILTYCYNSKLVYVTPGETYEVRSRLSPNSVHFAYHLLSPASHRLCPRGISGAQRRRSQPDMLRGSRGSQQSAG
jgi:hypothetical protein